MNLEIGVSNGSHPKSIAHNAKCAMIILKRQLDSQCSTRKSSFTLVNLTLTYPYLQCDFPSHKNAIWEKKKFLVSLHIRSVWETICDAWAGFFTHSKFVSKFSREPLSGISDQRAPSPSPPPRKLKFRQSWHFEFWLLQSTPPPPLKIEI